MKNLRKAISLIVCAILLTCTFILPVGAKSADDKDLLTNDFIFFLDKTHSQLDKITAKLATVAGTGASVAATEITSGTWGVKLTSASAPRTSSTKAILATDIAESMENIAYIAYKVKNNTTTVVNIGTRLAITSGVTRQAGAVQIFVYDEAGKPVNYTTSWSYEKDKVCFDAAVATVEIPAGVSAYICVPITSANDADRYVPFVEKGTVAFDATASIQPDGCLRARNASHTENMISKYEENGFLKISAVEVYTGGVGSDRADIQNLDIVVSDLFYVTRAEYANLYNDAKANETDAPSADTSDMALVSTVVLAISATSLVLISKKRRR